VTADSRAYSNPAAEVRLDELSSSTLQRVCAAAQESGRIRFLNGSCHTLALALWIADGGKGVFSAVLELEKDADDSFYEGARYQHMVYLDELGAAWDVDGVDAADRYIRRRYSSREWQKWQDGIGSEGFERSHEWVPVAVENFVLFLSDWHATDPLDFEAITSLLTQVEVSAERMEPAVKSIETSLSAVREYGLAPFNDPVYRRVIGSGFFSQEIVEGLKAVIGSSANEVGP
jgi:hypothetical protein